MGPRTIDLDLLLFKDESRATEFLTLPHPRMHQRRFVLTPLNELVTNLVHPTLHKSLFQLLAQCEDDSQVVLWEAKKSVTKPA
jgi:2-amino-4-hydroxy-6-hydroxymethyldihydropteridine diphosphokinase